MEERPPILLVCPPARPETKSMKLRVAAILLCIGLQPATPLIAAGTAAEGRTIIRLLKFESSGIITKSWEGEAEHAFYDDDEKCDADNYRCFEPTREKFDVSVRQENKRIIEFMRKNIGREMVIVYRRHRVASLALGSRLEITNVFAQATRLPSGFPERVTAKITGSRNFSVYGRVLHLEKRGFAVQTWEGLYLDRTRRKVHPFSVSDDKMAEHLLKTIGYTRLFHMGVSKALFTAVRETKFDIFEVNYNEPARG